MDCKELQFYHCHTHHDRQIEYYCIGHEEMLCRSCSCSWFHTLCYMIEYPISAYRADVKRFHIAVSKNENNYRQLRAWLEAYESWQPLEVLRRATAFAEAHPTDPDVKQVQFLISSISGADKIMRAARIYMRDWTNDGLFLLGMVVVLGVVAFYFYSLKVAWFVATSRC